MTVRDNKVSECMEIMCFEMSFLVSLLRLQLCHLGTSFKVPNVTAILLTIHVFSSVTVCQLVNCHISDERFGLQHSRVRLDSQTNKNTIHETKVITSMNN